MIEKNNYLKSSIIFWTIFGIFLVLIIFLFRNFEEPLIWIIALPLIFLLVLYIIRNNLFYLNIGGIIGGIIGAVIALVFSFLGINVGGASIACNSILTPDASLPSCITLPYIFLDIPLFIVLGWIIGSTIKHNKIKKKK